jgi:hypothetical protein
VTAPHDIIVPRVSQLAQRSHRLIARRLPVCPCQPNKPARLDVLLRRRLRGPVGQWPRD